MTAPDWLRLTGRREGKDLAGGRRLRLLSAREVLEARREAMTLAAEDRELALCSNACLVARCVTDRRGRPLYRDGGEVLDRETPRAIEALAAAWDRFRREEGPGLNLGRERLDRLKKAWSTCRGSAFAGVCSAPSGRCRRKNGPGT